MKINIKATGIEMTAAISVYVRSKLGMIEKYLENSGPDVIADVEVGKMSEHHKSGKIFRAEIHIRGMGNDIYAVAEEADLYAAVDILKDEVIHNAVQLKGKRQTLTRRGAEMVKNMMKGLTTNLKKFRRNK